jgi:hypothetical protein
MKLEQEIADEISKLVALKPKIKSPSVFGDDNRAAVDAQIKVLEGKLTVDEIDTSRDDAVGTGDEENSFHADNCYSSAIEAAEWLIGMAEPPSKGWEPLIQ